MFSHTLHRYSLKPHIRHAALGTWQCTVGIAGGDIVTQWSIQKKRMTTSRPWPVLGDGGELPPPFLGTLGRHCTEYSVHAIIHIGKAPHCKPMALLLLPSPR